MKTTPTIALTLLIIALLSTTAIAQSPLPSSFSGLLALLTPSGLPTLNQNLPGFAKTVLGTNHITLVVTDGPTTYTFWMSTTSGNIGRAGRGRLLSPSPTLRISTTRAVVESILASANPAAAAQAALRNNDIIVQPLTVINRFGVGVLNFVNLFTAPPAPPAPAAPPALPTIPTPSAPANTQVCEFNINRVAAVPGACTSQASADRACALAMGTPTARSTQCVSGSHIVCSLPCATTLTRCPFDNQRTRGASAGPVKNCPAATPPPPAPTSCGGGLGCCCQYGWPDCNSQHECRGWLGVPRAMATCAPRGASPFAPLTLASSQPAYCAR